MIYIKTIAKAIEVICLTDEDGTMHPVRFKVLEKSGEKKVYEILRVIKIEDSKFAGIRAKHFDCEIMFGAAPRLCQIKYELDTCKWVLYKI